MRINKVQGISDTGNWDEPKELVMTVDGHEMVRGPITGFRTGGGTMGCSNPDCIGCIEDTIFILQAICTEPPPHEPSGAELLSFPGDDG